MAQNCLNPSFRISKTIINHSHFVKNLKNPSLNSRWRLMVNRIRCSASSDGVGNALRTCKHCKTQFDPIRNSPQACRFHTAHFGGKVSVFYSKSVSANEETKGLFFILYLFVRRDEEEVRECIHWRDDGYTKLWQSFTVLALLWF
ncbi:unnamed protein product [Brassica oleracea var. botrytis]